MSCDAPAAPTTSPTTHPDIPRPIRPLTNTILIPSNSPGLVDADLKPGAEGTELEQHLVEGKLVGGLPGGVGSGIPGGSGGRGSGRGSGKGSGLMKTGLKSGGKGGGGEINYVSSANPELRLLDFDEDYDFNLPPPSMKKGPVPVNVSINLRNILQVKICVQPFYDGLFLSMFHLDWKTEKNVGSLAGKNGQSVFFFLGWVFFFRFDSKSRFPFASCEGCKARFSRMGNLMNATEIRHGK